MPLFPGTTGDMYFKGKTHTGLVVSEGVAPSEKMIPAKSEGVKFNYAYGPEGNQNVVIAKGKVVELGEPEFDYETGYKVLTVKQAAADSKAAVGVNHHNLYERKRDRFSGNAATVITRNYIEVPLFEHATLSTAQGFADAMKFGAAYGTAGALKPGDYVKVGANGNFTKLDTTADNAFQIIGQVWAVEKELPPAGLLAYFMDLKIDELEAFIKDSSYAPSPGKNGTSAPSYPNDPLAPAGGTGDAGAYPFGYPWKLHGWKTDFEKLLNPVINRGIPFLTDGYFKAKQVVTGIAMDDIYNASTNNDGHVESVIFSGGITFGHDVTGTFTPSANNVVDKGAKVSADTRNNALFIKLRHPIDRVEDNPVVVKADGVAVSASDVHIDYTNNLVVLYLEAGVTVNAVTVDAKLVVDPVAGIPTEWDYAGSVGAVRILLQR
jgi:hypothetical protein